MLISWHIARFEHFIRNKLKISPVKCKNCKHYKDGPERSFVESVNRKKVCTNFDDMTSELIRTRPNMWCNYFDKR
jgi:hypothetical protein